MSKEIKIPDFSQIEVPSVDSYINTAVDWERAKLSELKSPLVSGTFYDGLQAAIQETEDQLKENQELCIAYFAPNGVRVKVTCFAPGEGSIIILDGNLQRDELSEPGAFARIISSFHCLQLMMTVKEIKEGTKKQRIGFVQRLESAEEEPNEG